MKTTAPLTPSLLPSESSSHRWFSSIGCVVHGADRVEVFVGGTLIASFAPDDQDSRNVALIGLAEDPKAHLGRLAAAFGISSELLRRLRRAYERKGVSALIGRRGPGGSKSKVSPALRRRLERLFDEGKTVTAAHEAVRGRHRISRATVGVVRQQWSRARQAKAGGSPSPVPTQLALGPKKAGPQTANIPEQSAPETEEEHVAGASVPASAPAVQHAGTLLLAATVGAMGLHDEAREVNAAKPAKKREKASRLRLAIDAVIAALALGEPCVEGVRRLACSTAAALLVATAAPSATWVRRILGHLAADDGGVAFHLRMARRLVKGSAARAPGAGPIFYVDNHMRKYTGKRKLRKGWKMQEKRALPGTTDYYVHDGDGRPVRRVTAPHHGSLTEFLSPIAKALRRELGDEENILVAFDRGGSYPRQMADLRNAGFEFVTYERKPYTLLSPSSFTRTVRYRGVEFGLHEWRTNLGNGCGRVRRISLRTPDGRQVNLLAASERPAEELVGILRLRWNQENGFKHGVERWGMNQLDGRTVEPYEPGTVIPNPARARLDRALRNARIREGQARNDLARLEKDSPKRARAERNLAEAVAEQKKLLALRPTTPVKAPVEETELAGKLVRHDPSYKFALDTIRIACANAESDLAAALAPHLPRAAEAKKALANLFAAPGRLDVSERAISVTLDPVGTRRERAAFERMLEAVNLRRLSLPGDPRRRPVRFCVSQQ